MVENNGLYSIEGSTLTEIADAIREKSGSTQRYTPSEMAPAVLRIKGDGSIVEIVDNLTTNDATKALSAAQGVVLADKWGGCWIEFADENGNPTNEPYIHWMQEV